MLSSVSFTGAAEAINSPALAISFTANAFKMGFDVEEDEMLVEVSFKGYIDGGAAALLVSYQLLLDGAAIGAADGAMNAPSGVTDEPIEFRELLVLSKGSHKLDLALGSSGAATLAGTTFPAKLQVRSLSSESVLAHGVNAKSKGLF